MLQKPGRWSWKRHGRQPDSCADRRCWKYVPVWHDSVKCVTWLIDMCDMTYWYVWHDLLICVTWLTSVTCRQMRRPEVPYMYICMYMCVHTYVCICVCDIHPCVTRPIDTCDMTYWYVWHDSFICVTWLIDMCDMTHWYVWHDSLICVAWLIDIWDFTHWCMWHDMCDLCVTWLINMCHMLHWYLRLYSLIHVTWHIFHMCVTCVWHDSRVWRVCVKRVFFKCVD